MTELPIPLEDAWSDFRRSLARRGRKPGTVEVYRKSFLNFWRWALAEGLPPDPSAIDHRIINRWSDHLRRGAHGPQRSPDHGPRRRDRRGRAEDAGAGHVAHPLHQPAPVLHVVGEGRGRRQSLACSDSPSTDKDAPRRWSRWPRCAPCSTPVSTPAGTSATLGTPRNHRTLIDTGARRGELVALRLEDWDRRNDLLLLDGKSGPRPCPCPCRPVKPSPATSAAVPPTATQPCPRSGSGRRAR